MHKLPSNLVSSLGLLAWLKSNWLLIIVRSPQGWTSTCPCTTLEYVLLEIWLHSLCNTRTSSSIMPLLLVEGHPPWYNSSSTTHLLRNLCCGRTLIWQQGRTSDAPGLTAFAWHHVEDTWIILMRPIHRTTISSWGQQWRWSWYNPSIADRKEDWSGPCPILLCRPLYSMISNSAVGARGYLHSQNRFLSIFRIPPVVTQAPIMSHVNLMPIQDLTVHTQLVPL